MTQTSRIRLVNFVGPQNQLYYYRVNELAVYGDYAMGAATTAVPDPEPQPEPLRFRKPVPMQVYMAY